jgi:hypothetical protein
MLLFYIVQKHQKKYIFFEDLSQTWREESAWEIRVLYGRLMIKWI